MALLGQFTVECEAAGIRVSASMVLHRKKVICPFRSVENFELKYLGVLFKSEGRMEHEVERVIGAKTAVMPLKSEEGAESIRKALDLLKVKRRRPQGRPRTRLGSEELSVERKARESVL